MDDEDLTGRRILLIEDEYFIAEEMARLLRKSGAEILGPVSSVHEALLMLSQHFAIDGAILDINLRGEMAFAVADALIARQIPFVFATGYDQEVIPEKYAHIAHCEKPIEPRQIAKALFK
jgi:CheY-like chemotaxis protein